MIDKQPTSKWVKLSNLEESGMATELDEGEEWEGSSDDNGKNKANRRHLLSNGKNANQEFRRQWRRSIWRNWLWPMTIFWPRKRRRRNDIQICFCSALLAFPTFVFLLWLSGLHEFFLETPFSQFRWPPFVDVHKQVVLEMIGQSTEVPPINLWPKFRSQVLIRPDCNKNAANQLPRRKPPILVIVKSAPDRIERRHAIRTTYGSNQWETDMSNTASNGRIHTIFAMGRPPEEDEQMMANLRHEAAENGDLLVGNFVDDYFNNTLKFVHSIGFAKEYCAISTVDGPNVNVNQEKIPYLVLLDDDYLMLPWNLVAEADKHLPHERLYMGWRFDSTPFRFRLRKFRVSLSEYPFNAFPPYITGGAVLMTGQTVAEFHAAIQHTAFFKFDDVYAGILAYFLGIYSQHNPNFLPYSHRYEFGNNNDVSAWCQTLIAAHDYTAEQLRQTYAQALIEWRRTKEHKNQRN